MITEDYNGICPKCGFDRMLVRYGSMGWFQFDACTKCGFAYGTNHHEESTENEVWEMIIHAYKETLIKENYPLTREGLHQWVLSMQDPGERMGSVFVYNEVKQ